MTNLTENEMRLLAGIVLDRASLARETTSDENSEEMAQCISIIELSSKIVALTNKMYPVASNKEDLIIESFWGTK